MKLFEKDTYFSKTEEKAIRMFGTSESLKEYFRQKWACFGKTYLEIWPERRIIAFGILEKAEIFGIGFDMYS